MKAAGVRVQFQDSFGRTVGRCREWVAVKDGHACSARVLRMRYSGYNYVRTAVLCLSCPVFPVRTG